MIRNTNLASAANTDCPNGNSRNQTEDKGGIGQEPPNDTSDDFEPIVPCRICGNPLSDSFICRDGRCDTCLRYRPEPEPFANPREAEHCSAPSPLLISPNLMFKNGRRSRRGA